MRIPSRSSIVHTAADTFAMVTFSTVIGMASEIGVAGMDFSQSGYARLVAVPANLLTARPYGIFRDWFLRLTGGDRGGKWRRAWSDLGAFVLFQVPLYMSILAASGADGRQMLAACLTTTALCALTGQPYGIYLDYCRRVANVPTPENAKTK